MKKISTLLLIISGIILAGFTACKMSSVSMEVLIPADIDVPQHVQSVAVANRSLPAKEDKLKNILEGFITGESIFADREASENCVNGLVDQLNDGPRFKAVLASSASLHGTGTREKMPALTWPEVDSICKMYGVDALILLESFDSNIGYDEDSKRVKKTKDGREYYETEYIATLCIDVNSGWRIYDNINKLIIDENNYFDPKCWDGKGNTITVAKRRLPSKRDALNASGIESGKAYGLRISPSWVMVGRSYFVKGHDGFKEAKEHIKYDNWEAAERIWLNLSTHPDYEVAGRACYNMGLAYEVKGDLDNAIKYVGKSLREYHVKEARRYLVILESRKLDQQRLENQLPSGDQSTQDNNVNYQDTSQDQNTNNQNTTNTSNTQNTTNTQTQTTNTQNQSGGGSKLTRVPVNNQGPKVKPKSN